MGGGRGYGGSCVRGCDNGVHRVVLGVMSTMDCST